MQKIIIIGGGLSGLSSAYLLQQAGLKNDKNLDIKILEATSRIGGKIFSCLEDGYRCEWGPNGFLTNKPCTLQLCKELGIESLLLSSNDNSRKRFVFSNGKLHQLPHNFKDFLTNSLISWHGKLRIAQELFIQQAKFTQDESLANFTKRRLGEEALNKLIAPMASGIFAGNPETMSLIACFPRIYQLEREYGGLIKAMLKLQKSKRYADNSQHEASPAGPGGVLTSFNSGIQVLTDRLANQFGLSNIYLNQNVYGIRQLKSQQWEINTSDSKYIADKLIIATPAHITQSLFASTSLELSELLNQIDYSPLVVVCLGYDRQLIEHDLQGFGYLFAKEKEISLILGTLWDSSIFSHRAPDGKVLFRTMLGGALFPNILDYTDEQLIDLVTKSLYSTLGINCNYEFCKVYRHQQAIPQYNIGHNDRVKRIEKIINQYGNLYLTGNAYYGVGINDCIARAYQLAQLVN